MRNRTARHRTAAVLVAVTGLALLATGCREDVAEDGGGGKNPSAKPTPSASKPADDPSGKPAGEVDGDVGKTLPLGQATKLGYQRGSKARTVLQIATTAVKKGSQSDLGKVSMDAEQRAMQPYYVTMTFENVGEGDLGYGFLDTPAGLRDSRGEEGRQLPTMGDDVPACQNPELEKFGKGSKATACSVFLLPKGETPSVVTYTADYEKGTVYWKSS